MEFTKKKIRELCRRAYKYGKDNSGMKQFYENEGSKIKRDPQIDLGVDKTSKSRKVAVVSVDNFNENIDYNIYDDIVDSVSFPDKTKRIEIFTPPKLIEKIKDLGYSSKYSQMRQEPFGSCKTKSRYIVNHRNKKIIFIYYV